MYFSVLLEKCLYFGYRIEGRTDFDHKKMKQNLRPKDQVFLDTLAAKKILERGLQEIHRTIALLEKEQQHSEKKE